MSRWTLLLFSAILLAGCAVFAPTEHELSSLPPEPGEVPLSDLGFALDGFLAAGDVALLDPYLVAAPQGRQHAVITHLVSDLRQCRADYDDLLATHEADERRAAELTEKNQHLRETIDQLKSLLIQLEQRAH